MAARRRPSLAAAVWLCLAAMLAASCATAHACAVEGAPLAAITPPVSYCFPGQPSHPIAAATLAYVHERYAAAAEYLEPVVSADPEPGRLIWWWWARFLLARSYTHLGQPAEAEALFLDIVRTADDPHRWAAAGWLCGEPRTNADLPLGQLPPCPP